MIYLPFFLKDDMSGDTITERRNYKTYFLN